LDKRNISSSSSAKWLRRSLAPAAGLLITLLACTLVLSQDQHAPTWPEQLKTYLKASRDEHNHHVAHWRQVAAWSFQDGKVPAEFKVIKGQWKVHDGKLIAAGGKEDDDRTIQIAQCQWPAFRLEYDAALLAPGAAPERVCDVGIRFNVDMEAGSHTDGYFILAGTYFNQATTLYRMNIPLARTEWSPIVPGKTHHVVLEVVKPHIRFWIDDHVVLEAWDRPGSAPANPGATESGFIDMDPKRAIALETYDTIMEITNLKILVPETAAK
jgi:hypothetical protein